MHDDVTGGLLAGAGDGLHIILVGILVLMVLGMMGHWWFWAIIVPAVGLVWWAVARHRRREAARRRAEWLAKSHWNPPPGIRF
jgi:hypothetical protein